MIVKSFCLECGQIVEKKITETEDGLRSVCLHCGAEKELKDEEHD